MPAVPAFIREGKPLSPLTTFAIGGAARWFAEVRDGGELAAALDYAGEVGRASRVIGGGSNLLIADRGVDDVVIRLAPDGRFAAVEQDGEDPLRWRVGAAASLARLVAETSRRGIRGLEALAGIPGSVGGAAVMNAGGVEHGIGAFVAGATVVDPAGSSRRLAGSEILFSYRRRSLAGNVVVGLEFRFRGLDDPEAVVREARARRSRKMASQPLDRRSAGCFFKNPPAAPAGWLLDRAGCRGMREGGAEVSEKHANFIVNRGNATCGDVLALARRMRGAVSGKFAVTLEPEVEVWGLGL